VRGAGGLYGGEIKAGALQLRLDVFKAWSCAARQLKADRFSGGAVRLR
jgi:hypothetical protein